MLATNTPEQRYPHVETIATLCPYIHDKELRERWNALNDAFEEIARAEGATPATTKNGRCQRRYIATV